MKIVRLALFAVVFAASFAAAQTPRPDRSVDADGTGTAERSDEFEKNREKFRSEIAEIKREIESLRAGATKASVEKLDAVSARVEALETRTVAAGEGTERDYNETKHKFKNEIRRIRRELKGARKHQTAAPDLSPAMPGYP